MGYEEQNKCPAMVGMGIGMGMGIDSSELDSSLAGLVGLGWVLWIRFPGFSVRGFLAFYQNNGM